MNQEKERPEELFEKEKDRPELRKYHIEKEIKDPLLKEIDGLYADADALSMYYAEKYRRILFGLSLAGTLLSVSFLLYDEINFHGMILACGVFIVTLFAVNRVADRLHCHRKYLEYRLLAEGARVQYYLARAGIRESVTDLMPWPWKFDVPWTVAVLERFRGRSVTEQKKDGPAASLLDIWIIDQKAYHQRAYITTEKKEHDDGRFTQTAMILAIITYIAALVFEIVFGGLFGAPAVLSPERMETIRVILKVAMGTFSAVTVFTGNYYGKLSLEDVEQDHRRMAALYEKAEKEIRKEGESEELLLNLAREELNENSSWYAYQKKNRPEVNI